MEKYKGEIRRYTMADGRVYYKGIVKAWRRFLGIFPYRKSYAVYKYTGVDPGIEKLSYGTIFKEFEECRINLNSAITKLYETDRSLLLTELKVFKQMPNNTHHYY